MARNTIARIHPHAMAHNLARARALAPDSRVMAVVKADAYGHRIDLCLPALVDADMLAVATIEEARAIRRLGNGLPVLLLEGVSDPGDLAVAADLGLELTVHHREQVAALKHFGRAVTPRLWLKIDTGMHRLGVEAGEAAELHRQLLDLPGVEQVNLVTHLACAESPDDPLNAVQLDRFDRAVAGLAGEHCLANSAALFTLPESHRHWVRAGVMLYGISPLEDRAGPDLDLRAAMSLTSELMAVNRVGKGERIGYGGRFVAPRDMRIGVAAVGYGDGYPRSVADGTAVMVNGRLCRLAGRVSMDMITIDLSNAPEAGIGAPVELWGANLPVEEVARSAGTIPYELVCRITRRVRFRSDAGVGRPAVSAVK